MYFFKNFDNEEKVWVLYEGTSEPPILVKTSDGQNNLQSAYPEQIDLVVDDLERYGEIVIKDGVLNTPNNSLYNIFSLTFHIDELKSNLIENMGYMLMRDELFFNTGNGPPLEMEQIERKTAPLNLCNKIFGPENTKFMLNQGLARYYFESATSQYDELSIDEYNEQVGIGILVSYEEFLETEFFKKIFKEIKGLEDREVTTIKFLIFSFPESVMLCYLLIKGQLKQGEFLRAILACRFELLDSYFEDTTNKDYREAYAIWQNEVTVALNYLKYFIPPDREHLLKLVESEETEIKEFKAALRFDMKTGLNPPNKDFYYGIVKTICGMANNKKASGGEILIGYYDKEKTFIGIEKDGYKNFDDWELNLRNRLSSKAGEFVGSLIEVEFLEYAENITCALIKVKRSSSFIFCKELNSKKDVFFVRNGPRTASLDLREFSEYKEQKEN